MKKCDVLIVGCGAAGLYCALNLPEDVKITVITKSDAESSDSFLAQGGICVLKDMDDYDAYYEDTMKAGHYENDPKSVEIMIKSSAETIKDLIKYGVDFETDENGELLYTREGGHSCKRILFHKDVTGKEITKNLLAAAEKKDNITIIEYCNMLDIIEENNTCHGVIARNKEGELEEYFSRFVVWACGGIGGLFRHSTNFRHLTGDCLAISLKHGIELEHVNYIQIHPTTLYSKNEKDRSFLISESVRGEGAKLYNSRYERFVNELLPRDVLTAAIKEEMKKEGSKHVWEDMRTIDREELLGHFPNIVQKCKESGYDVTKECIPVVPAQHYFMGGVKIDYEGKTSMKNLYAVGEAACNNVHGKNRLASNSLLEAIVFAKRAADDIIKAYPDSEIKEIPSEESIARKMEPEVLAAHYKKIILDEINRMNELESENDSAQ